MGGVELPPYSLAWDGPILESASSMVALMSTSSKRTYADTPHLSGLLLPVPLTLRQASVNLHLCRRLPHTHRQVWLSLLWRSLLLSLGPGAHTILFMPSMSLWQVWGLILTWSCPSCHLVVTSLSLDMGYLFFGGFQHPSVGGCFAASCDFDVLTGGEGCTSLYSAMPWLL